MTCERILITAPAGLRDRAHAHGLNVSAVAAAALLRSVEAIEKETPASSRQTSAGVVTSCGGT